MTQHEDSTHGIGQSFHSNLRSIKQLGGLGSEQLHDVLSKPLRRCPAFERNHQ